MMVETDPDFATIARRIRDNVGRQGFMIHVGAELFELTRGTCTLAVDRRPELLQQHGLFHGGVTAFLVDNATTIAAATSRGQPALTAEYKLNLLSPAAGERLICRARDQARPSGRGRRRGRVLRDRWCRETHRNGAGVDCDARRQGGGPYPKPGLTKRFQAKWVPVRVQKTRRKKLRALVLLQDQSSLPGFVRSQ